MMDTTKFTGIITGGGGGGGGSFYDMAYYRKLGEETNMSVDSIQSSTGGGSVAMSVGNSSVGSSDSQTGILYHNALRQVAAASGSLVGHRVFGPVRVTHALSSDALAQVLMDPGFPTQGLDNYDEWTLDLRQLNLGESFAQGAFGKLYRGCYNGEDVAIKLLEKPENELC